MTALVRYLYSAAPVDEDKDVELVVLSVVIGTFLATLGAVTFFVARWLFTHQIILWRLGAVGLVVGGFALMVVGCVRVRLVKR